MTRCGLYRPIGDGNNDLCVVDKNANIYWIRVGEIGQYLEDYHAQVPKLKVSSNFIPMKRLDDGSMSLGEERLVQRHRHDLCRSICSIFYV